MKKFVENVLKNVKRKTDFGAMTMRPIRAALSIRTLTHRIHHVRFRKRDNGNRDGAAPKYFPRVGRGCFEGDDSVIELCSNRPRTYGHTHEFALDVAVLLERLVGDPGDVALDHDPVLLLGARQRRLVLHEAHHYRVERVQNGMLARYIVFAFRATDGKTTNARVKYLRNANARRCRVQRQCVTYILVRCAISGQVRMMYA